MANFVDRYRRSDGHYPHVECAYVELERRLLLSCNEETAAEKKMATKTGGQSQTMEVLRPFCKAKLANSS
jgi:hypothetical protein